ncbi:MAG: repeat protein, partial [Phycisphaerales bacterium]|nr:repeat protein [Phycisphaerales bacterium]
SGGDFLKPDVAYHFTDLGGSALGGQTWRLYVEAVRPSQSLGDGAISISVNPSGDGASGTPLTDNVRTTAFCSQFVQADAQGAMQPVDALPISHPTPVINLSTYSLDNLRLSADGSQILTDIHVAGTITDAASNLIAGAKGTISTVNLFLNGSTSGAAALSVSVSKSSDATSTLSPYPYSGSFDQTLTGVAVQPGWNLVRLTAANAYGFAGFAEASMQVTVDDPPAFGVELLDDPYTNSNLQVLHVQFSYADGSDETLALQRDPTQPANQPPVFVLGSVIIDTRSDPNTGGGSHVYSVTNPGHGANGDSVTLVQAIDPITGASTLSGSCLPDPENATSYKGFKVSAGTTIEGDRSTGGDFNPLFIRLLGPSQIAPYLKSASVGAQTFNFVQQGSDTLFANPGQMHPAPLLETVLLKNDAYDKPQAPPAGPRRDGFGEFAKGFGQGLIDTGSGLWDGAKSLAKMAWYGFINTQPAYIQYRLSTDHYASERQTVKMVWTTVSQLANVAWQVVQKNNADQADLVRALITGDNATLNRLGAEYQKAGEVVAELLDQLSDYLANIDDYTRGRIIGRVVGEAVVLVLTEGAGQIAELSKATLLQKLLPRLRNIEWLQPYIGRVIAEGSDIEKLAEGLKATKMCFVAGTPVHTERGLRPIEQVRAGDLVLSRDEKTGEQSYKPVVETFVTQPTRLYHVRFATGASAETTLTCTGQHPFYVNGRGFVAAQELAPGDELVLAEGGVARVACITPEDALEGKPFTTYNFEVADFHTYFVGQAGVWVHNLASGLCERMFSLYKQIVDTRGLQEQPWEAFKLLTEKTAGMSEKIDAALPDTVAEVMEQVYKKAVRADGTVDLTKIPTVKQMREVIAGRGANALIDAHHTAVQAWTRKLIPGITQEQLDSMPGLLLRRIDHRISESESAFHAILQRLLPYGSTTDKATILSKLEEAYNTWDPKDGPIVWKAARQWLRQNGVN